MFIGMVICCGERMVMSREGHLIQFEGQREKWRPKRIWKKQVDEEGWFV